MRIACKAFALTILVILVHVVTLGRFQLIIQWEDGSSTEVEL